MEVADAVCFNAAIASCSSGGGWQMALHLLGAMGQQMLELGVNSCNSGISACGRAGQWEAALAVFSSMASERISRTAISFNAAMSACEKATCWAGALVLFEQLALQEAPDAVGYGAAISACAKASAWAAALGLLGEAGARASGICWNAAITACEKGEQWERALLLLSRMPDYQLRPDVISCNSAISACEKSSSWQLALALLHSAPETDIISFNAAISACSKGRFWTLALDLLAALPARRLRRDGVTFAAAANAAAPWAAALALRTAAAVDGVPRSTAGEVRAIDACGQQHWQHALNLLFPPMTEANCFHAALGACVGHWQQALQVMFEMQQLRLHIGGVSWGTVLRAMLLGGEEELAARYSEQLRRQCLAEPLPELPEPVLRDAGLEVVQGKGVLAVLKPGNCTSESVLELFSARLRAELALVSRLDAGTSGVLPLAVGRGGRRWLEAQFGARQVHKEYICLCAGESFGAEGTRFSIDTPLLLSNSWHQCAQPRVVPSPEGKEARTEVEVLEMFDPLREDTEAVMLLAVSPLTGRTHQIRAHLSSLGRPLVGDRLYGDKSRLGCRVFLHCRRLRLLDLAGVFKAEFQLPEDLRNVLAKLREKGR
ncbi:unnamed protein product [Effrenium voratum]|nr:unnamed protein product [Effrenium voratum]